MDALRLPPSDADGCQVVAEQARALAERYDDAEMRSLVEEAIRRELQARQQATWSCPSCRAWFSRANPASIIICSA